ncbi:MAG: hypothetical protein ACKO38_05650 [Planctomycetota bacterium]
MRYLFATLLLSLGLSFAGCAGSDPEPPKESIPDIPPGRGAPGGGKMPGAPNGVPAPPK